MGGAFAPGAGPGAGQSDESLHETEKRANCIVWALSASRGRSGCVYDTVCGRQASKKGLFTERPRGSVGRQAATKQRWNATV